MELSRLRWPTQASPEFAPLARVVLLHGMGGTGRLWRPIAASLESQYSVLAPDQRGHGGSRIPSLPGARSHPSYGPLDYASDVVETLQAETFSPAFVVGHSMGVRTGAGVAHLAPVSVLGLVCVDLGFAGAAGGGLGDGLAHFLRNLPESFENRTAARDWMTGTCPDPAIAQYLLAVSEPLPGGRLGFPFDRAALIETIEATRDSSVREWIREYASTGKPVLALRGANSLVWSREDFEAEKRRFGDLPSVRFEEMAGAGHGLPFEKRAEFARRLIEFFVLNRE